MTAQAAYQWECHPKAEQLLLNYLEECCRENPFIEKLRHDLLIYTSTRLLDWLDHIVVGDTPTLEEDLEEIGFISETAGSSYRVFFHPGAQLPRLVVKDHDQAVVGAAVTVESIADFLMVRGMTSWIEGAPLSGYRRACVSTENNISLWVVERKATHTMEPTYPDEGYQDKYLDALEKWQTRPRNLENEEEALTMTLILTQELVSILGKDLAAWVVLEGERKYWQVRNFAAQIQKNRQDKLGMGWANHDHHTFRSSRRHFSQLVRLFEILGFHCRERFYAGEQAGWGAQVMENAKCGLILFLDVDLEPHEVQIDFAHHAIPETKQLGTIGLWCELHGDSILKSGMHHLEAQFFHEELTKDLSHLGVGMMERFSDFPYLKQAFTHGEIWQVDQRRINKLLEASKISHDEAEKFEHYGAVGSHLENLQRREGYKGFNQDNVSFIIKKTDPRTLKT